MAQPILHRVYIGGRSQFIHEEFIRKIVLNAQRRTQWPGVEGRYDGMGEHALALYATAAIACSASTACDILWNGIASVVQLLGGRLGGYRLHGLRLVAQ